MFDLLHHYHRNVVYPLPRKLVVLNQPKLADWQNGSTAMRQTRYKVIPCQVLFFGVPPLAENNKDDQSNQPSHPNSSRSHKSFSSGPKVENWAWDSKGSSGQPCSTRHVWRIQWVKIQWVKHVGQSYHPSDDKLSQTGWLWHCCLQKLPTTDAKEASKDKGAVGGTLQ